MPKHLQIHNLKHAQHLLSRTRADAGLGRMLPAGDMAAATLWLAGGAMMLAMLLGPAAVRAADEDEPVIAAPLVDWAVAKQVYGEAEKWVEAREVATPNARPLRVSGVIGVRVTLRLEGMTLGVGDATTAKMLEPKEAVDLRELTARATTLALQKYKDAGREVFKQNGAAAGAVNQKDDLRLTVDMQIGHSLETVQLLGEQPAGAAYFAFASGYHGLRIDHPVHTGRWAMLWPATALASNILPENQVTRLLADVGYKATEIPVMVDKLGREDGPAMRRFKVIHLVRPTRGQPVTRLIRGNELIPRDAVSVSMVNAMAQRLTGHLSGRILPDGDMTGTYWPSADRYDPAEAFTHDAALAGYALARQAELLAAGGPNNVAALNLREKATVVVNRLRQKLIGDNAEDNVQAKALLLLTILDSSHLGALRNDRDLLAKQLRDLAGADGLFVDADRKPFDAETQAIIFAALVGWHDRTREKLTESILLDAQDAIWAQNMDQTDLVQAMPWLAPALVKLHRLTPDSDKEKFDARVKAVRTLSKSLRDKKLVRSTPSLGPADVVGGYDLVSPTDAGAPRPDWRTAPALALVAETMTIDELKDADTATRALVDGMLNVRYLAQLMFDEASAFYMRGNQREVIGGVRLALRDNRLALRPSAMTLLALTRFQEAVSERQRAEK